jgi:hypothetical protein
MEFTDGHLRLFNGAEIVTELTSYTATDISTANPTVVTVGSATDWATDDQVIFSFENAVSKAACGALANRAFRIVGVSTTTFKLYDAITGVSLDGSLLTWATTLSVTVKKIRDIVTPYTSTLIPSLRVVQSEEDALLLQATKAPRVLTMDQEPTDTLAAQFSLATANFRDGPYLDPVTDSIATPSGTTGLITLSLSFTAYSATKAYQIGDFVTSASIGYRSIADQNVGNTPATSPTKWEIVNSGEAVGPNGFQTSDIGRLVRMFSGTNPGTAWTWGKITALGTTGAIDPLLAGSVTIGNMTNGNNAFDSLIGSASTSNPFLSQPVGAQAPSAYIGKDYSGAAAQTISSVIIYPSFTEGWAGNMAVQFHLYGKATAPTFPTIGAPSGATLLGSSDFQYYKIPPSTMDSVTIVSNDVTTTWNYVWIEMRPVSAEPPPAVTAYRVLSEVQFFSASGVAGASATVQVLGPALANTTPMITWRLGVYSATTGYPTCGCYHEGRLWLSGVVKNRWDASKSNDIFNFEPTAAAGTVADSNGISYTFNSSEVNPLFWMKPGLLGITCGTPGGEWLIQSGTSDGPITPTSVKARRVTRYKCANVEPIETGLTTVFVQKFKRRLIEYLADAYSGKQFGPNLSEFAKHLTKYGVDELAFQDGLTPIVWGRRADGKLIGCTYRRVSLISTQPPEYYAWHQHTLGSGRKVESICVGPSADGLLDTLSVITNDETTGIRHVEILTDLPDEDALITDAFYLDNAITPSHGTTTTLSHGESGIRFHGLWHLNGKKVTAWIGGIDCGEYTVTGGYIDVSYGAVAAFTFRALHALSTNGEDYGDLACSIDAGKLTVPAVVGFSYRTRGQILRPASPDDTGARNGPGFGKLCRAHEYGALLRGTQGISFGTDFARMRPANFRTEGGGTALTKQELFSGLHTDILEDKYTYESQLCWEVTRPYPATVLAIGGYLQTQDK